MASAEPIFQADVVAYRLGQVEKLAESTARSLELEREARIAASEKFDTFMAAMPANYVPRKEHETRKDRSIGFYLGIATLANGAVALIVNAAVSH